jgi:hypothetical protein
VTIDPSSIPNFGPQSGGPGPEGPGGPEGAALVLPDQDLVKQLLEQMELKFAVDEEDDLLAPWEDFRIYFMFRGDPGQQIYVVRTFYDAAHSVDDKPRLLEAVDEWNRNNLWPKVYSHTDDEGVVRLIGDVQLLIGNGIALEQFITSTVSWVRASVDFEQWIAKALGLTKDAEGGAGDADGGADSAE